MSQPEFAKEIDRIKQEYHRRNQEIPDGYYSAEKPINRFFYEGRLKEAKNLLEAAGIFPLQLKKTLEIGCGACGWLPAFEKWGTNQAHLYGVDLGEGYILQAKERMPKADLRVADASELPWPDQFFDIVIQSTVFSSILLYPLKQRIASEMLRVLKSEGVVLWYDFFWDNPRNPNVRGIKAQEIYRLFPHCEIDLKKITLAPPLARSLAPFSISLCRFLEDLKFLNTHYLAVIRRKIK